MNDIIEKNYNAVMGRVAYRVPPQDAEDVTQEIFMAICESIDSFNGKSALSTWMRRIEFNKIADYYRKRGPTTLHPCPAQVDFSARRKVEENLIVWDMLKQLDDKSKETLTMLFLEQFTLSEAADELHLSYEAIRSRRRRAIKNAGKLLEVQ